MNQLVTIITPVYNVSKYLPKCLDSLINQTYKNLEIILINDGSTDNSGDICDEYSKKDDRIKVIHKENGGVSSARNAGLKVMSGQWLFFVDPDDWIELATCEKILDLALATNSDIYAYGILIHNEDSEDTRKESDTSLEGKIEKIDALKYIITGSAFSKAIWNKFYKKSAIQDIYFDEQFKIGEDVAWLLEAVSKSKDIYYISQVFYNYLILRQGSLITGNKIDMLAEKNFSSVYAWISTIEILNPISKDLAKLQKSKFAKYLIILRMRAISNKRRDLLPTINANLKTTLIPFLTTNANGLSAKIKGLIAIILPRTSNKIWKF